MVRIISPKGQMLYVMQIQPVCEKQILFNGKKITIMDGAKNGSVEPTALAMKTGHQEELVVGNLKPETVREIVRTLCEKEYYDFSALAYQDAEKLEKIVMDNGESAAYNSYTLVEEVCLLPKFCKDPCFSGIVSPCFSGRMLPDEELEAWMFPSAPIVNSCPDGLNWDSMEIR